mmetsp:Transcript_25014/g.34826  ORF Transcript_25014/g.34826 Transcript_25014/m.34826 type:complete len:407 (+) Transcript_25014:66-1286(+)|eukprot:CAMPEP_0184479642 /NCGR_PEP_ID=MMETSP0113_2-20130426/1286_1 /TAXON_ID=91329 /ORGANISM="Norrisiella sphaerica, Strain BC52" /LENGTH=406 /DNA_ID=CAMNT_0026857765 /DNA_START=66 /DNA_END=1286 /DNA_ORIENTATION=+
MRSTFNSDVLARSSELKNLTTKKVQQITNARNKLLIVQEELQKQYLLARKMQESMHERYTRMQRLGKDFVEMKRLPHSDALDAIFEKLKRQELDSKLVGQEGRTLYDFVDEKSVQGLQEQTGKEIAIVRSSLNETNEFMKIVDNCIKNLTVLHESVNVPDTSEQELAEKIHVQNGFLKDIEYHTAELTDLESKLGESMASQERRKHVRDSIMRCEDRVASVAKKIESTAIEYGVAYEKALNFFTALEDEVPRLKTMLQEFEYNAAQFDQRIGTISAMLTELKNLVAWYHHFHDAYGELLREIERRQIQMQEHQILIQKCQQDLDEAASEESARRDIFSKSFGRYLPPGLCPGIYEPVVSCRILPPKITSELPRAFSFQRSSAAKNFLVTSDEKNEKKSEKEEKDKV